MPRLPSEFELGGLPSAISSRPIVTYDGGAVGEGITTLGKGIADAGTGLENYAEKQKAKTNALEITSATSGLNSDLIAADAQYQPDKDVDYATWKKRHNDEAEKALQARAAGISDPYRRELFLEKNKATVASYNSSVDTRANKLVNQEQQTKSLADINQFTTQAFEPNVDEAQRDRILQQRDAAIDASIKAGVFSSAEGIKLKAQAEQRTNKLLLASAPLEDRQAALRGAPANKEGILDRIGGVENATGDPAAKNPNSSAMGNFQFIGSTWKDMIGKYRPDLAKLPEGQLLGLRADPKLSREMAGHLLDENAAALKAAGVEATPGNLYLAHFLGAGDAAKVLKAAPGTPISSIVTPASIDANKSVLAGKTVDSVIGWSSRKMGGSNAKYAAAANALPPEERASLLDATNRQQKALDAQVAAAQSEQYNKSLNDLQIGLHDGTMGATDISSARKAGWLTDIGDIQKSEAVLAKREKDTSDLTGFYQALGTPGFAWNPMDKAHKDMVDAGFTASGGDINSLQNVVEKTHIVPSAAAVALRGSIASSDPQRAQAALTVASNLQRYNPNVFAGVEGGAALANQAVAFNHYVNDLGLDADKAAKKVIDEASPEYEASTKAKVKSLNVDQVVKDNLKPTDLASAFNNGLPFFGRPELGAPNAQIAAMGDYEELFRDNYLKNGDVGVAKAQAIAQMKMIWGVSRVTGTGVLTRYPPDMAPAFAGVENASQAIADQAAAAIKATAGADVPRDKLIITPNRETPFPYKNGQPPPFSLSWIDKSGHVQVAKDMFIPNPNEARRTQTERRQTDFATARAARNAPPREGMDLNTQTRPMFGNPDTVAPTTAFPDRIAGGEL